MYEIQKDQSVPVKFFAGEYPVVTAVKAVATGKSVKQYEPVKLTDSGIEPVVKVAASEAVSGTSTPAKSEYENTTAGIYGIAATAAEAAEEVVVYLTGEFFADAITLPEGVTADTLAKAFRNIGIFLKYRSEEKMAIETTIYTPRTLGKLITRMPPVHTFFRDTLFKNRRTFPTKSVDVDFKKGSRALAPFVHPKVGGKVVPNSGYQTKTYTPVLLAPDKITTVDDLLNRSAGENPYSGRTPAERAVEKLADDLRELNEMIVRREEWMAATAIFTGQIPIIGEGLNEVIDFDFTNKETIVSAEKKWNADTSDPLGDLERWREAVQKEGFVNCNICIMAKDVANAFVNNAKVKSVLDVRAYDLAVIKPRELPNGLTYIGTIHKLGLDIYQYNEWYLDNWTNPNAPTQKPLVPDGTLALLSTEAEYSIYYGAITMIPEEGKTFVTVEGDRVPQTWVERRPDRRFLQVNSKPLTVPHEVNSWYVAKVL